MNMIKGFLLYGFAVGFVTNVVGLILLLTDFHRGVGVWTVIYAVVLMVVVTVIWLALHLGGRWLKNKGLTFVTWEGNVLNLDVKLFGVTIGTVRLVYENPIKVVRRRDEYEVTLS